MASITLDPAYHDEAGYDIPLLGLHVGPGETLEMSDEEARGFLHHPHITVDGLTVEEPPAPDLVAPVVDEPPGQPAPDPVTADAASITPAPEVTA